MSETMMAIQIAEDDERTLQWAAYEKPAYGPDQVLVRVRATALNRADLLQRRGLYPVPPGASEILGLEVAGEIVACGRDVEGWHEGDAVCVLLEGGAYAAYAACDASMLLPKPASLSWEQAAALPEVFYTAYVNLVMEGALQSGEAVLLHAGASGVGTAVIQLCQHWGNPVWATTSTTKVDALRQMGVEHVFDRKQEGMFSQIKQTLEATGQKGFDVIFDPVGAAYLTDNLRLLNLRGRLVLIGLLGGNRAEVDLGRVLRRRLRLVGSVLRSRSRFEKVEITKRLQDEVWPLFAEGVLRPIIDRTFPITEAHEAHAYLATNQSIGKVILSLPAV